MVRARCVCCQSLLKRGLRRDDGEAARACLEEVERFGDNARLDAEAVILSAWGEEGRAASDGWLEWQ